VAGSALMKRLLIVHHTVSPGMQEMYESVHAGATTDEIEGVQVVSRAALSATAADVLAADGILLGSPVNIGYISGALKHFFDGIYYPCLEETVGRPFAAYLHTGSDPAGALRAIAAITTGLRWREIRPPLVVTGTVTKDDREACWDLGATCAATLALG
jgi:multimeric flavodoxin WrbA